jgi:hypothetical protein
MIGLAMVPLLLVTLSSPDQPGTVEGNLTLNKQSVVLKYAYAHLHDNAEKVLNRPRELRILLVDREVPPDALMGMAFPPVWGLARDGAVRGLLIELNPADPNNINIILLDKPKEEGRSMTTLSMSKTGAKLFKEWRLTDKRVSGALDRKEESSSDLDFPTAEFTVRFDAPISREHAITAELKGPQAARSPQVAALLLRADAIMRWDMAALKAVSTKRSMAQIESLPPSVVAEFKKVAKKEGAQQKKELAKAQRVVVRGDRATVIIAKGQYATVVKEGGKWKVDD